MRNAHNYFCPSPNFNFLVLSSEKPMGICATAVSKTSVCMCVLGLALVQWRVYYLKNPSPSFCGSSLSMCFTSSLTPLQFAVASVVIFTAWRKQSMLFLIMMNINFHIAIYRDIVPWPLYMFVYSKMNFAHAKHTVSYPQLEMCYGIEWILQNCALNDPILVS